MKMWGRVFRGFCSQAKANSVNILVLNCGSSSIKSQIVEAFSGKTIQKVVVGRLNTSNARLSVYKEARNEKSDLGLLDYPSALALICDQVNQEDFAAIGHRVVHGGPYFKQSTIIDDKVKEAISRCSLYAPLHNPKSLEGISVFQRHFPNLTQVASFDTAFHQTLPQVAHRYPIPETFYQNDHIRKYGFHGLSHGYVISEAAKLLGQPLDQLNLISAHLGNGCSVAASKGGKSVDTSMGLTPLEGLMMGQRSGDLDPAVALVLQKSHGLTLEDIMDIFNSKSGFLGVAGTADSLEIEQLIDKGDAQAELAADMFCYRLAKYIGSYYVALGSQPDAIIFTGGIGELSALKREKVMDLLQPLGVEADDERNNCHGQRSDGYISSLDSPVKVLVIPTNEELVIAREAAKLLE